MKHVPIARLEAMIDRIDSREKARIAEEFIMDCDLTEQAAAGLLAKIETKYNAMRMAEKEKTMDEYGIWHIHG